MSTQAWYQVHTGMKPAPYGHGALGLYRLCHSFDRARLRHVRASSTKYAAPGLQLSNSTEALFTKARLHLRRELLCAPSLLHKQDPFFLVRQVPVVVLCSRGLARS